MWQRKNIWLDRNFNFVLDNETGEYFMLADYDDLWEPSFISEMVKILDNIPQRNYRVLPVKLQNGKVINAQS